jgi:hypothetical protein
MADKEPLMTTKTFPLSSVINLVIRMGNGSLRVTALDDASEASVSLTAPSSGSEALDRAILERVTVELRNSTLHISSTRPGGIFNRFGGPGDGALDVEVTVPSGTPIKVGASSVEITIVGRCGNADIAAGSAEVKAECVDGELRMRCGSGRLEVGTARGRVRFRAGSGGATLGAVYEDVDLASGSGALSVGVPAGVAAKLELTSGSGRVDPQLEVSPTPITDRDTIRIRARTGAGDIRLFAPPREPDD